MINLPGYLVSNKLHEGKKSLIYKGIRESDRVNVLFKFLKDEYPSLLDIAKLKYEYEVNTRLNSDGVVKIYSLESFNNTPVLVIEDFGGESLKSIIRRGVVDLPLFIVIAIKLADALSGIHRNSIAHKDLNPNNIIINLKTGQVKITDFEISTFLSDENQGIEHFNSLEGTIPYISPEQTGRMNRPIDYRTDFYSLGITFYEMLSGVLPFVSEDPLELVHCHLAREPMPLYMQSQHIPRVISNIIMKLMEKKPEARYQSALGLKQDLLRCAAQLKTAEVLEPFELGVNDISDRFHIPQRVFGREKELEKLLSSFKRISSGKSEIVLVSGYSGIGKSFLVKEIHKPVVEGLGYFTSGKFDQLKQSSPYYAIIKAFQRLINQILSENEEKIQVWKSKLSQALGVNGGIITTVIPDLEKIIGIQPPVPELPPSESQNRFILVFKSFIKVFASKKHPLVVFIDNLQWADQASLNLIEDVVSDFNIKYILFVCGYRDNEVNANHPIAFAISEIEKSKVRVSKVSLTPLDLRAVSEILGETLKCDLQAVEPLAEICLKKTGGNPFFLNQYLYSLHKSNLVFFSPEGGSWQWDLEQIKDTEVTDNVVDLMIDKIKMLSLETQNILQLASGIGNTFELSILSSISEKSTVDLSGSMLEAVKTGLVVPLGNDYKYLVDSKDTFAAFKFFHNKVQQAAYSMLDEANRIEMHYNIGKLLLKELKSNKSISDIYQDSRIFDIANHLNIGITHIEDKQELLAAAELNLKAGKKSKDTAAYQYAFDYLDSGLKLLNESDWSSNYELCLQLHVEAAEAAYTIGRFREMEQLVNAVVSNGKDSLDKIKVYEIKIQAYIAQNRLLDAVNIALGALKLLNVKFPSKPKYLNIIVNILKSNMMLLGKDIVSLVELPEMTDPYQLAKMRIMSSAGMAAYSAQPELLPLFVCKSIEMSLKAGNCSQSSVTYLAYGFILCGVLGSVEKGYSFGRMALDLMDKKDDIRYKGYARFIFNTLIRHWKESIQNSLTPLLAAYQNGLDAGDIESSAYSAHNYCSLSYFSGKYLANLQHEMSKHSDAIRQLNHTSALNLNELYRQVVLNLISSPAEPCILKGEGYDEYKMLPIHVESKDVNLLFNLYFNKSVLFYMFDDLDNAYENIKSAEKYLNGVVGTFAYPLFHFYSCLTLISQANSSKTTDKHPAIKKARFYLNLFRKWARFSPVNHLNKYYLLRAEFSRLIDQPIRAMEYYDKAISLARESEFLHEEALANELAAKYYFSAGKERIAYTYIRDARFCYLKWGANSKVKALEEKYSDIFSINLGTREIASATVNSDTISTTTALDINTIIKSTQALSGEIVLDELLRKLIKIILENSGAQNVFFIMKVDGELFIEAEGSTESDSITVMHSAPMEGCKKLPESIINYVIRTQDTVMLDNASDSKRFINDSYIINRKPKSILCTPIINNGRLLGILYLENNLISGAFSQDRIEILNILCSQLSISIENASLYNNLQTHKEHLEELVRGRTKELTEANSKLQRTTDNIKNLLNNAGQGFLSFSEDMLINEDYSAECRRIFGTDIAHMPFMDLIYPYDLEQRNVTNDILICVFAEADNSKREIYLSLLPEEILINDKYLKFDYKLIKNGLSAKRTKTLMVIITDITVKRSLEQQMKEERNILRMVVKVVANYNDFVDCLKDYEHFYSHRLQEILSSGNDINSIVYDIYRNIHNFKGNFSQLDFRETVTELHRFETDLSGIKNNEEPISINSFKEFVKSYPMRKWVEKDIDILKSVLGEQFFKRDSSLNIEKSKLVDLEKKAMSLLSPIESQLLLPHLRQLRYQPFSELLKAYPEYIMRLSEKLDKPIYPMEIIGGDVLVDTDKYSAFTKSLVHVFRNSLDHGIENINVRYDSNKHEFGRISSEIKYDDSKITLIISDDGRGINIEALKSAAIAKGLASIEKLQSMPEQEIYNLLFIEEFSTKDTVDELSGRGIGLFSVKKELDKLGGKVIVKSKTDIGTELHFELPHSEVSEVPVISTTAFMGMLNETINRFFYQNLGMSAANEISSSVDSEVCLKSYTVLISLKGALWGKVILSADENLGKAILHNFSLGALSSSEQEEREYIEDVLGECLNTVLGNLLKRLHDLQELIIIEPPTSIYAKDACLKYMQSEVRSSEMEVDNGRLSLSFVRDRI